MSVNPLPRPASRSRPRSVFFGPAAGKAPDPRAPCYAAAHGPAPRHANGRRRGIIARKLPRLARQQKKPQRELSRSGCTARLAISISWLMPLTELSKQQTRPRG